MAVQIQHYFHPNGRLRIEIPQLNGRPHGLSRAYHSNGQLASEISYENGLQHGPARAWAIDGRFLGEYILEHGTGVAMQWHENGTLWGELPLQKGMPTGRQRTWLENGESIPGSYWVRGEKLSRKKYLEACKNDPDLPRYNDSNTKSAVTPSRAKYIRNQHGISQEQRDLHDQKIGELRAKPNQCEAREWLATTPAERGRWFGETTPEASKEIVKKGYAAGAEEITAVDIESDQEGNQSTSYLIIRLPGELPKRKRVFKWSNELAIESGFDQDEDWGQSELFVFFD